MNVWQLVPVEPTMVMKQAGADTEDAMVYSRGDSLWRPTFDAMLSASPDPTEDVELIEWVAQIIADKRIEIFGPGGGLRPRCAEMEYAHAVLAELGGHENG